MKTLRNILKYIIKENNFDMEQHKKNISYKNIFDKKLHEYIKIRSIIDGILSIDVIDNSVAAYIRMSKNKYLERIKVSFKDLSVKDIKVYIVKIK